MQVHKGGVTYSITHSAHGLLVSLGYAPLMVTQDGDHTIGLIIRIHFLLYRSILRRILVQLLLKRYGRVVGTEHLSRQSFHVRLQVLVK